MDYTQLTGAKGTAGSIATWTNNSRIVADVPEIILEAESWIYRRLRHWRMLADPVATTLVIGQDYLPFPGDLLEPFYFGLTGDYRKEIVQVTAQQVLGSWQFSGATRVNQLPSVFYLGQSAYRFDSPPDQAYAAVQVYYQQPAPLVNTTSNFLTTTYPRLLRAACMAAACEWLKDFGQGAADRGYWDQMAQDEIDKAQIESDRARRGILVSMQLVGGAAGPDAAFPAYGGSL